MKPRPFARALSRAARPAGANPQSGWRHAGADTPNGWPGKRRRPPAEKPAPAARRHFDGLAYSAERIDSGYSPRRCNEAPGRLHALFPAPRDRREQIRRAAGETQAWIRQATGRENAGADTPSDWSRKCRRGYAKRLVEKMQAVGKNTLEATAFLTLLRILSNFNLFHAISCAFFLVVLY